MQPVLDQVGDRPLQRHRPHDEFEMIGPVITRIAAPIGHVVDHRRGEHREIDQHRRLGIVLAAEIGEQRSDHRLHLGDVVRHRLAHVRRRRSPSARSRSRASGVRRSWPTAASACVRSSIRRWMRACIPLNARITRRTSHRARLGDDRAAAQRRPARPRCASRSHRPQHPPHQQPADQHQRDRRDQRQHDRARSPDPSRGSARSCGSAASCRRQGAARRVAGRSGPARSDAAAGRVSARLGSHADHLPLHPYRAPGATQRRRRQRRCPSGSCSGRSSVRSAIAGRSRRGSLGDQLARDHQMLGQPPRLVLAHREAARSLVEQGARAELDDDGQQQDREDAADQPDRRRSGFNSARRSTLSI